MKTLRNVVKPVLGAGVALACTACGPSYLREEPSPYSVHHGDRGPELRDRTTGERWEGHRR